VPESLAVVEAVISDAFKPPELYEIAILFSYAIMC